MQDLIGTDKVIQIGLVVRNINACRSRWALVLGLPEPPVIETEGYALAKTRYHGEPSEARCKLCYLQVGQVQIELIEPAGRPSSWQDHLDAHGESVQHIAFEVPSMSKARQFLADAGMPATMSGEKTGGRYAYVDSSPQLGVCVELLENDARWVRGTLPTHAFR